MNNLEAAFRHLLENPHGPFPAELEKAIDELCRPSDPDDDLIERRMREIHGEDSSRFSAIGTDHSHRNETNRLLPHEE